MNFMLEIYILNLHILWIYILDTTTYIKFIKRGTQSRPDERTLKDILQNTGLQPCVLAGGRAIQ